MKLAFCLFNYFPYGGLQRDFIRIARTSLARGHEIHVYTMRWDAEPEDGLHLHLLKVKGLQNHTRCQAFTRKLKQQLDAENYDLVIGFNKMPYLDWYYAADVCYVSRVQEQRGLLYRLLSRYRRWRKLEESVFQRSAKTKIMLISPKQEKEYTRFYHTENARFHLLPPGIAKDRIAPANAAEIRTTIRDTYKISPNHFLLLMVGSGFKTKGLDRTLHSIAALSPELQKRCQLFVIGQDDPAAFIKLARQLRIEKHVHFLGGRPDVPQFLLAADLLVHPSYHENTGTVLLEALAAGLPVLTVEACGYAHYVGEANAGIVVAAPFQQERWNNALEKMLLSSQWEQWHQNALAFARVADIYSMPEKAVDLIELNGIQRDIISA